MDNLNKDWFAYPSMNKYPLHTKAAALQSYRDFQEGSSDIAQPIKADIESKFKKAAEYHDITLPAVSKTASAVPDTILFKGKTGDLTISKIDSVEGFKEAANYILNKRASMKRADLQEAAKYVVWAAANSDAPQDTPELIKVAKIAGIGVGNREDIQHAFEKRATLCILEGNDRDEFWKYAKDLKELSDEEFYKESTLNKICDTIEEIDFMYNNTSRYGKDLEAPEDAVFADNMDDLLKEASDLMYIPSVDATLSKTALLERKDKTQAFFEEYLGANKKFTDAELIDKVASLDFVIADRLLEIIK